MAFSLGIFWRADTVAEEIEVEAQREILLGLGCRTGQGYMFGRPMPIAEIFEAAVTRRCNLLAGNRAAGADGAAAGRLRST
jgi:predicted signal transduction protein with EAL and GGDEF domain